LIVEEHQYQEDTEVGATHTQKEIMGVKKINNTNLNQLDSSGPVKNPCWICDGWMELEFEWSGMSLHGEDSPEPGMDPDDVDMQDLGPVFIHFRHEGYQAIYMRPDGHGRIAIKLMVPKTRLFFFFTINNMAMYSEDYVTLNLEQPEHVVNFF
jgi:hypothetical protein